jgi:two-component system, chemotaxis family, chemotaxis protein CheY
MTAALDNEKKGRVKTPILVVDDDEGILDLVIMTLEFEGFTTRAARDGAQALEIVERERPAAILLDMRMPVMDGWGFARALAERGIDIPIVVMTAAQDAPRWAEEIGADAYIEKPFDLGVMVRTVEALIV